MYSTYLKTLSTSALKSLHERAWWIVTKTPKARAIIDDLLCEIEVTLSAALAAKREADYYNGLEWNRY